MCDSVGLGRQQASVLEMLLEVYLGEGWCLATGGAGGVQRGQD